MEEKILFNDWETRIPGAIKHRKKNYILSSKSPWVLQK